MDRALERKHSLKKYICRQEKEKEDDADDTNTGNKPYADCFP